MIPNLRYGGYFLHFLSLWYLSDLFLSFQSTNTFFFLTNAVYSIIPLTNGYCFLFPQVDPSDTNKSKVSALKKGRSVLRTMELGTEEDLIFNKMAKGGLSEDIVET